MARRTAAAAEAPTADTRILVLYGTEEMLKRDQLDALRTALHQKHGDFESLYFNGETATLAEVFDELRTYSLMQPFKLVLVDDADEFVKRFREPTERYAQAPMEQAALVLRSQTWNKGNLDKSIAKVGQIVKCDPLSAAAAPGWLVRRCQTVHKRSLTPQIAGLLVERLGPDLMRLDSELAKLVLLAGDQAIDAALVDQVTGRGNSEKAWVIQEALLQAMAGERGLPGGGESMIQKVHELVDLAGHDDVPVSWAVADLMRKLCLATMLRKRNVGEFQITKQVGVWGPASEPFSAVVRRLDAAKARRWFDRIMEMDLRVRSSRGDTVRNLECFCSLLADEI